MIEQITYYCPMCGACSGDMVRFMLEIITSDAKRYHKTCNASLNRNKHMNNLEGKVEVPQEIIDAILTDFINYIASKQCIDYGLYTTDLREEETANVDKRHR